MRFNSITVNYDSPAEQEAFEKTAVEFGLMILGRETWEEDSGYDSWTEFDITGFTLGDLKELFSGVDI